MIRQIAALSFIFICATIAWVILGSTILYRTHSSDDQLKGHVGSTWGTTQEQPPPNATYTQTEVVPRTSIENGKTIIHNDNVTRYVSLPLESSRVQADLKLDHRQKGLLWYSTYVVDFAADYTFRNSSDEPRSVRF